MVVVDHKVPVVRDGKVARTFKVGPGKMYRVTSVDANGVTVVGLGSPLTFKAEETDIIPRAEQLRVLRDAPPPPTPSPSPEPTPSVSRIPPSSAAPPAARPPVPRTEEANVFSSLLSGQLVRNEAGTLAPYEAGNLSGKKYLAVYFSASWCGPCRRFTPELVNWYHQMKRATDDFELIFVSADNDASSMQAYMTNYRMPWPAVRFDHRANSPLLKYAGRGIPCLVVLAPNGSVLSNSYENNKYLGPRKPLRDLEKLLAR
jgi:Thiol-disulfide isomerase and thioredoxins